MQNTLASDKHETAGFLENSIKYSQKFMARNSKKFLNFGGEKDNRDTFNFREGTNNDLFSSNNKDN